MTIPEWQEECLVMIGTMNSQNQQAWSKAHAMTYALILSELGEDAGRAAVVKAIKMLKWRPTPAELREIAAELCSPVPSVGLLWQEFWHKAIHMEYARPEWTHPLLAQIASMLGGWKAIRESYWPDSEPARRDALRRRFEAVYAECVPQWREAVCEQLQFPPHERDPKYFPKQQQFIAPKSLPPGDDYAPFPALSEIMVDAPEDVKQQLSALRKRIAS